MDICLTSGYILIFIHPYEQQTTMISITFTFEKKQYQRYADENERLKILQTLINVW